MNCLYRKLKSSKAFTLVELLVVISIIALLVAIVLPQIGNALFRGRLMAVATNGKSIYTSIFAHSTEQVYTTTAAAWPESNTTGNNFADSSKFFDYLVTNGIMNVSYSFFAAPNVPTAANQTDFIGAPIGNYCAWNVTEDITDSSAETLPVLFTKNVDIDTLGDATLYTGDSNGISSALIEGGTIPFGKRGVAFVTKGGAALIPFRTDLRVGTTGTPGPFRSIFNIQIQTASGTSTNANNSILKATP